MTLPADAPSVHPLTEQWYDLLPEIYQLADMAPGGTLTYPLLRFMSLVGDLAGSVSDLIERIAPPADGTDYSELVDPDKADVAWLLWLAQLPGVKLTGHEPEGTQRALIDSASSGWRAGTKDSIAAAAKTQLIGSQYVEVLDHMTDSGTGGEWDLLIKTRSVETPSDTAVLLAVGEAGVKPAGVKLWIAHTAASWDSLEAAYPTNDAWDATGSWDVIESTTGDAPPAGGGGAYGSSTGGYTDSGSTGGF